MSEAAQLTTAIVVGSLTGGAGLGVIGGAVLGSLGSAGAISGINVWGRGEGLEGGLKATVKTMGDNEVLKDAAIAGVTAGVGNNLGGVGVYRNLDEISKTVVETGINTGISTVIKGGEYFEDLRENLKTAGIDYVAKDITKIIGNNQRELGGEGSILKILSHGAVGCLASDAKGGDCESGALGSGFAELISKKLSGNGLSNKEDELLLKISSIWLASLLGKDAKDAMDGAVRVDKYNRQFHGGRNVIGNFKHGANIVERDNLEDYTEEQRAEMGEPIYVEGRGYVYVVEDLNINGKLTPVINGRYKNEKGEWELVTLEKHEADGLKTINKFKENPIGYPINKKGRPTPSDWINILSLPNNYGQEDKLLSNHLDKINNPGSWRDYPSIPQTIKCTVLACKRSDFYNSNSSFRERMKEIGITPPKLPFFPFPGY